MLKFYNFSIVQILRETKVGDVRGPKLAILTHLESLIFDIYEFLHFRRPKIYLSTKFRTSENAKVAIFQLPECLKLISCKI